MQEKRKLISNSFWMMMNRITQSVTTFVLSAAIARLLGAEALGQYLLAFSYYFIFVTIASQGVKVLFTRELARNPEKIPVFITNGTLLQLILSFIAYLALVIVVFCLPYNAETSTICYIMGLNIIPFSLSNITESVFQSQEKMNLIGISTIPIYFLRLLLMLWLMRLNYGIEYLAWILFVSELIILLVQWVMLVSIVRPKWQIDKDFIWESAKAARTFFAIEGITVLNGRFQILILSLIGNEFLVGIYGGCVQLMQPFLIVANSIAISLFPRLSKAVNEGKEKQIKITEYFIELLLVITLPSCAGFLFLGDKLLISLYNPNFIEGSLALKIISLSLLFIPFNRSLAYVLVANNFERFNLREVIITTTISLASTPLVAKYQLLGASIVDLLIKFVAFTQYFYYCYKYLFVLNIWNIFRRPLIITSLMMPVFIILQMININFALTLIIAICSYTLFIGILIVQSVGGIGILWEKYLNKQ